MAKSIESRFADVLRRVMNDKAYTQPELAKKLKIPLSSLQNYLEGRRVVPLKLADRIAKLAGLSLDEILHGKRIRPYDDSRSIQIDNSPGAAGGNITISGDATYGNKIVAPSEPISENQLNDLKKLVDDIVQLEQKLRERPKSHGAVWKIVFRRLDVEYSSEIRQWQFETAKNILMTMKDTYVKSSRKSR
ncbi:helix-turn-helix domain-containing protein [bacterium]|nr:helix-turn-helix domain-containing protein [bacterium]